jgi:hypothetical protein
MALPGLSVRHHVQVSAPEDGHVRVCASVIPPPTVRSSQAALYGEFGDAPGRYASAKARKNYAGTSPLTIESGKKRAVHARYIRNRHLIDALHAQALSAITASPGARAYYDELRARDIDHDDALRRLASRLAGILHGCVKDGREYDEAVAWSHRAASRRAAWRRADPARTRAFRHPPRPDGSISMP